MSVGKKKGLAGNDDEDDDALETSEGDVILIYATIGCTPNAKCLPLIRNNALSSPSYQIQSHYDSSVGKFQSRHNTSFLFESDLSCGNLDFKMARAVLAALLLAFKQAPRCPSLRGGHVQKRFAILAFDVQFSLAVGEELLDVQPSSISYSMQQWLSLM